MIHLLRLASRMPFLHQSNLIDCLPPKPEGHIEHSNTTRLTQLPVQNMSEMWCQPVEEGYHFLNGPP